MTQERADPGPAEPTRRPILLLLGYYGLLIAAYFVLSQLSPWFAERLGGVPRETASTVIDLKARVEPLTEGPGSELGTALLTMSGALLLVLQPASGRPRRSGRDHRVRIVDGIRPA